MDAPSQPASFVFRSLLDKVGPLCMVYKCPMQTCNEEFVERSVLATHLDSRHPQYGGACASSVHPTPSAHRLRGSLSSGSAASGSTSSLTALTVDTQIGPVSLSAASRNNFFFLASPSLRFVRRLAKCYRGAKRPIRPVDIENFEALKAQLLSPDQVKKLAAVVYRNNWSGLRDGWIKSANRLHALISRLTSIKTASVPK